MNPNLRYVLARYFAEQNITNKETQAQHSIVFKRHTNDGRSLFIIKVLGVYKCTHSVTKKSLGLDDHLTIDKGVRIATVDKYVVEKIVQQYTQGFFHGDVGTIMVDSEYIYIYIHPRSFCYNGMFKIRRI